MAYNTTTWTKKSNPSWHAWFGLVSAAAMHDLHVIQGPNVTHDAREKIAFFAFHAFVVEDSRLQQNWVRTKLYNCSACLLVQSYLIYHMAVLKAEIIRLSMMWLNSLTPRISRLSFGALKVAEHSFSARFCWCKLARAQGFQKQICRQQSDHFIYSKPALSVLFFSIIECSVLMALVFYYNDMLQKVTMQRTQHF